MDTVYQIVWLALLIIFAVAEAATVGLTSVWFAIGSLGALVCALAGGNIWLQLGIFIVLSLVCLVALRPLAKKYLNTRVEPTNADRVIGQEARVTQDIDNIQGTGAVTIGGVTWTARSEHDTPIPAGAMVRVLRIEGVKVIVEE
ncbi:MULTISPECIES: NfeD family protein [Pseudoflavonifractor]|uniref:NfeD family protein n=1 Tax=Candidatus Enterenecus faecium TaxID=2840780 RepID=A0A9D1CG74_9FIRM|nr:MULTISPECIES: NfeD family protein [Pseudoflavonifractor]MBM6693625.1 NfeD family protein [Pseudoflavonifractor capillosus]OUP41119.1 nodulation protein NfeD [Pseudoflavonifractor sp. An187]OUP64065.1 nodulation protein NfeD [Pseudoflavonifractor sp. An176]HIQ60262.1 NfeD family protein [Candidatus Enterenecus faecium]